LTSFWDMDAARIKVNATLKKLLTQCTDPDAAAQSLEATLISLAKGNLHQYQRDFKLLTLWLKKRVEKDTENLDDELADPVQFCGKAGVDTSSLAAALSSTCLAEANEAESKVEDAAEDTQAGEPQQQQKKKKKKKKKKNYAMKDEGEAVILKAHRAEASESSGMGMFATANIKKGDSVVRIRPALSVIFDSESTKVCGFCFSVYQPFACKECNRFSFCESCNSNNALKAWHARECKLFSELPAGAKKGDTSIIRMLIRHRVAQEGPDWVGGSKEGIGLLTTLQANKTEIPQKQITVLSTLTGVPGPDVANIIFQVRTNAASIVRNNKPSGCSLSVQMGYTNHDCTPNCVAEVDVKGFIHMVAQSDISVKQELTISYVDPSLDYPARQATLKDHYGFVCKCSRCQQELREQLRAKIKSKK